jgi:hypothetical protein
MDSWAEDDVALAATDTLQYYRVLHLCRSYPTAGPLDARR